MRAYSLGGRPEWRKKARPARRRSRRKMATRGLGSPRDQRAKPRDQTGTAGASDRAGERDDERKRCSTSRGQVTEAWVAEFPRVRAHTLKSRRTVKQIRPPVIRLKRVLRGSLCRPGAQYVLRCGAAQNSSTSGELHWLLKEAL